MLSVDNPPASSSAFPPSARPNGKGKRGKQPRGTAAMEGESIEGGSWAALHAVRGQYADDPRKLAQEAINAHITSLSQPSAVAAWMAGNANQVFARWGASLGKFFAAERKADCLPLAQRLFHPNPMCVPLFVCLYMKPADYAAWLEYVDDEKAPTSYDYAAYKSYMLQTPKVDESKARAAVTKCIDEVKAKKSMCEISEIVQNAYKAEYGPAEWQTKLLYDEGVFLLGNYVRAAASGDIDMCRSVAAIVFRHYMECNSTSILSQCSAVAADIQSGPVYCKLVEFILSESFMYPNAYSLAGKQLTTHVEELPVLDANTGRRNYSAMLESFFQG